MDSIAHIRERLANVSDPVALLEGLFTFSPIAFQVFDVSGRCLVVNQAFRDLFGTEPPAGYNVLQDEIVRERGILDLVHRAFAGETTHFPLTWYDPRDLKQVQVEEGRRVAVTATFFPMRDRQGAVAQVGAVFKDLTAETTAREQAESERDLLNAILEGTTDAVYLKDLDGRYLRVNQSGAKMFGRTPAEVVGRDDASMMSAEAAATVAERDQEVLRSGQTQTYEVRVDGPGAPRTFLSTKGLIRDRSGTVKAVFGITREITERQRLEAQLRQAHKMEAVGRLAGGIAHEFNNLLMVVVGYGESLRRNLGPCDIRRTKLDEILRAAGRATDLTRQLLAFARKQVVQPRSLDLSSLVEETLRLARPMIGEDITVETTLRPGLAPVRADGGLIQQVALSLLINARDAMPQGGTITVETDEVELDEAYAAQHLNVIPGPYVVLSVGDTGPPMDEATQARLFDPFFTSREQGRGSGLGLATTDGIVEQSGGHIAVESQPGRGTHLRVHLPRFEETVQAGRPGPARVRPTKRETILVVEDEPLVRGLVRETLEEQGYMVLAVADGDEALRASSEHDDRIHLLLTDVVMPGLSGPQLAQSLRAAREDLDVLYMSGYTGDAGRIGDLPESGAFIEKPFTPDALGRKVREVLDSPVVRTNEVRS